MDDFFFLFFCFVNFIVMFQISLPDVLLRAMTTDLAKHNVGAHMQPEIDVE